MTALLLALVVAATGISRPVDPALTAIAESRVVEIQTDFSHAGADPCCPLEVLAWESGHDDPLAYLVEKWRQSPPHWSILSDPTLTRIGCAAASTSDGRTFAVCVLAGPAAGAPTTASPPATVAPPVPTLPDTATEAP